MTFTTTSLAGLKVVLTTHRDTTQSLLMVELTAEAQVPPPTPSPMQIAFVIDRSGSMSGRKLEIAKAAVARFIRTLGPDDRVTVVAYDDEVDPIASKEVPSEALASRVERLDVGGSTNLYGGWVLGAKLVGRGGRVILLSDGQANCGRYTDARSLSRHAGISRNRFGVTTSTVGVGSDYDEALMAGMAQEGGGTHYFAHDASAIADAFSRERFSADAVLFTRIELRFGAERVPMGDLWGGETKRRVVRCGELDGRPGILKFTRRDAARSQKVEVPLPTEFGHDDGVRLEWLFQLAADAEGRMIEVRDPRTAGRMREELRAILLQLLAHPAADSEAVRSVITRLQASVQRLAELERDFREEDAVIHRKRSTQQAYNLRERAKAFTSFEDDRQEVLFAAQAAIHAPASGTLAIDPNAYALAKPDQWLGWCALPVGLEDGVLTVAVEDPRDGFIVADIRKALNIQVRTVFAGKTADIIRALLTEEAYR